MEGKDETWPATGAETGCALAGVRGGRYTHSMPLEVILIDYARDPLAKLYGAYRTCYTPKTPGEVWAEIEDGHLALTVENAAVHLPEILSSLKGVESVEVHVPTLNDVFLRYTGREIREEDSNEGWASAAWRYQTGGR